LAFRFDFFGSGAVISTTSVVPQRALFLKSEYLIFLFACFMFAYVLWHNESFLIHSQAPVWKHYEPFKWWLLAHGVAGAFGLVIAPLQLSDRLRQRATKLHRVMGRIYVAAVFTAGSLGIYIKYFGERMGDSRTFTMAAATHGGFWMVATGIAFALILKGKVQQHRQWMTRSIFLGPGVFLGVRAMDGITGLDKLGPAVGEASVWFCIAFSILLADVVIQLQESSRSRPSATKRQAAAT
jgi:uncharacterized membrane protein